MCSDSAGNRRAGRLINPEIPIRGRKKLENIMDMRSFANGNEDENPNMPQPIKRRDWQTQFAQSTHSTFWKFI